MDEESARQFGLYLGSWIAYFLVVYFSCTFLYLKWRGKPPGKNEHSIQKGKSATSAMALWEERDAILRKRFLRIGMGLMALPLLWPLVKG